MARSTTWSMVVGAGPAAAAGPGVAVFCGAAAGLCAGDDCGAGGVALGEDEDGAVVCCAIALNGISREAVSIHFQVRMTRILSRRA